MFSVKKDLSFYDAGRIFAKLGSEDKKIVQCHGTFDLLLPSHIIHFEEVKTQGVTITAKEYVNKGLSRPYFNDERRVKYRIY